jgi:hypothetical protein
MYTLYMSLNQFQIKRNNCHLVAKKTTNANAEHFANANTIIVQTPSKEGCSQDRTEDKWKCDVGPRQHMMTNLTIKEPKKALGSLKKKKSPGKDGITKEMLINLGKTAKKKLLAILNLSWKLGIVPQVWKDAIIIPVLKKGEDLEDPNS